MTATNLSSWGNIASVVLLASGLALGCASPEPHPLVPDQASVRAVQATFGDALCRRIEGPEEIAALVAYLASKNTGWQAFWGDPVQPQVSVVLFGEEQISFGLANSQLLGRVDGAPAFRQANETEANRFIELLGGVPVGLLESPCF